MGFFSHFENKMEDSFENAADKLSNAPISPVQIAKKAEKRMRREKIVGAGKQYAPTLYTVLVNPDDDARLFGYYATLAGETETYLSAKASEEGLIMDGKPLVRFIVDEGLRRGKFDIIAEPVTAAIVEQLRHEEMVRYGIEKPATTHSSAVASPQKFHKPPVTPAQQQLQGYNNPYAQAPHFVSGEEAYKPEEKIKPPLPYVPQDQIDYSIDYGEYTFNSEDFEDYRKEADPVSNFESDMSEQPISESYAQINSEENPFSNNTVVFTDSQANNRTANAAYVSAQLFEIETQKAYDLAGASIYIGREANNDIVLHDVNVSRRHAELKLDPRGYWILSDLRSTNGTYVNGIRIASQPLHSGDLISFGKIEFQFIQ